MNKCSSRVGNHPKRIEDYIEDLLLVTGFSILDKRKIVQAKYLPDKVSLRLYKRIKTKTDIDIVVQKSSIIFIVSCKFDSNVRKKRTFSTLAEETYYLTKWYMEQNELKIGVPVITTNLPLKQANNFAFVIPFRILERELNHLIERIAKKIKNNKRKEIF